VTANALGRESHSPAGTTTITRYDGDRVTAEVDASADAWLFLADTYDPAWQAYVDGSPRPLRLANAMFRAVGVPAGHHIVEMRYQPLPLQRGAVITLLTGAGLLLVLVGKGVAQAWMLLRTRG